MRKSKTDEVVVEPISEAEDSIISGTADNWFDIDKAGMAKIFGKTPKSRLLTELVSNVWDTGDATKADITVQRVDPERAMLRVVDDSPGGFLILAHAYTLYAESTRKKDPTKRGRFNRGEKIVLSMCDEATITTTKATIIFNSNGRSIDESRKTEAGTVFEGIIPMTDEELQECIDGISRVIVPQGMVVTVNGKLIEPRESLKIIPDVQLRTVYPDEQGNLKDTRRKTDVHVYATPPGEEPMLFEMGIPVVGTDMKFDIDVQQKLPLNSDRDQVQPAVHQDLRVAVANAMTEYFSDEDFSQPWLVAATSDKSASAALMQTFVNEKFGEDAVIFDPHDTESAARAIAEGRRVIYGNSMSKAQRANVKGMLEVPKSSDVFPSRPVFTPSEGGESPLIPESEWSTGMAHVARYIVELADTIMGVTVTVQFSKETPKMLDGKVVATYGGRTLTWYVPHCGKALFNRPLRDRTLNKHIIHELAHEYVSDHLSSVFNEAQADLWSKFAELCLDEPERWQVDTSVRLAATV